MPLFLFTEIGKSGLACHPELVEGLRAEANNHAFSGEKWVYMVYTFYD